MRIPVLPLPSLRATSYGLCVLLALCGLFPASAAASALDIEIQAARNAQGRVVCGLYDVPDAFRKAGRQIREAESPISGGKAHCRFDNLPPGRYAVAAFHAEHGEREPSYGFLGKPRQGVAFTNDPSIAFGPPHFDEAAIEVGNTPLSIMITLKY